MTAYEQFARRAAMLPPVHGMSQQKGCGAPCRAAGWKAVVPKLLRLWMLRSQTRMSLPMGAPAGRCGAHDAGEGAEPTCGGAELLCLKKNVPQGVVQGLRGVRCQHSSQRQQRFGSHCSHIVTAVLCSRAAVSSSARVACSHASAQHMSLLISLLHCCALSAWKPNQAMRAEKPAHRDPGMCDQAEAVLPEPRPG